MDVSFAGRPTAGDETMSSSANDTMVVVTWVLIHRQKCILTRHIGRETEVHISVAAGDAVRTYLAPKFSFCSTTTDIK